MSPPDTSSTAEVEELRRRVGLLQGQLDAERRHAAQWRAVAEERRVALERLRRQPAVRALLAAAPVVLPPARRAARQLAAASQGVRRALLRADPVRRGRGRRLRQAALALPPPPSDGRRISVVVVQPPPTALDSLRSLLGRPDPGVEIVVVGDPPLRVPDGVVLVPAPAHLTRAAARNLGASAASGDVLCFLEPGLQPLSPHWLRWLGSCLGDDVLAAVPRVVELSGQHGGVELQPVPAGPPRLDERRWAGVPSATTPASPVAAADGPCLVVAKQAFDVAGGFDERHSRGEDLALCWSLRHQLGGRVVVVHQSLLQREDASGGPPDRERRLARQEVVERLGPSLTRSLELDRIAGTASSATRPYSLIVVLGRRGGTTGPESAEDLPDVLRRLGWRVARLAEGGPGDLPDDVDAVVVTAPGFDVGAVPPHVTSVAWLDGPPPPDADLAWLTDADAVVATGPAAPGSLVGVSTRRPPFVVASAAGGGSPSGVVDTRARTLRDAVQAVANAPRIAFVTGIPERRLTRHWGDWPFAQAMAREVRALGFRASVHTSEPDDVHAARAADVLVQLRGRGRLPRSDGQAHVIWSISHPAELTVEECDEADLVLVASHTGYDVELRARSTTPVSVLLQATDARRFRPRPPVEQYRDDVVFVGNSRSVERPVVRDALAAGLQPVVYGRDWERFIDPSLLRSTHVDNAELPVVYSSAGVLLNDHWDDMRRHGYASNRLFDALATGAVVVSDQMDGLDGLFHGAVVQYRDPDDLRSVVRSLLEAPDERARRGELGRRAVLAAHTFEHRAAELVELLSPLLAARAPALVED